MEKQDFLSMIETYKELENERKEILEDINEKLKNWAASHNLEVKQLRKAIKNYIQYEKDKTSYLEEDAVVDNLLNLVINEETWGQ